MVLIAIRWAGEIPDINPADKKGGVIWAGKGGLVESF
jgi:hypothetical protein